MDPGSILAGRYRVGSLLGRGGMGIVVQAVHLQLGTPVAIKVLRKEALDEPALVERFLREAQSAARLRGEHICRVQDFGTTEDGTPFMVMEYLEGDDLNALVDRNGKLDPTLVATYILQACIGIAEAHSLGIVHRDVKPGNLFLVKRPDGKQSIKLLDFGIAKVTTGFNSKLTQTTKAMGSPAYMAPEQLRSSGVADPRSDIWSLGITMYELLTEGRPFDGDTPYELTLSIANDPPVPLPDTVPADIAGIVMRCLDKNANTRYGDVAALADALAPLVKHGTELAASVRAALTVSTEVEEPREPAKEPSQQTLTTLGGASAEIGADRPRSRFVFVTAVVGLVALAIGGVIVWQTAGESTPATEPPPAPVALTPDALEAAADVATIPDAAIDAAEPIDATEVTVPVDAKPAKPPKPVKPPRIRKPHTKPDFGSSFE